MLVDRSAESAEQRSPTSVAAAALIFTLPLLAAPFGLIAGYWSARQVLLVGIAPLAVPLLTLLWWKQRNIEVAAATAFLAWACASTALSTDPSTSFWGAFSIGTGLVFVAALVACWALGRLVGRDLNLVQHAAIAVGVISSLIAVLQVRVDLSGYGMGLVDGRADAMTGNPVFLGCLLAASYWTAASLVHRSRLFLAAAGVLAVGVQLTGSRIALIALLGSLALARITLRSRAVLLAATMVGIAAGTLLVSGEGPTMTTGTARISSGGGITARTEMWASSVDALVMSPVAGAGPGMFQPATSQHRTLDFVQAEGLGKYYFDAHNLLVEYSVTTGLVGAALLCLWLGQSLWRADLRSALGGFAVVALVIHLVQPQTAVMTPLALVALGAAPRRHNVQAPQSIDRMSPGPRRALSGVFALTGALGATAALSVLIGFWMLDQARLDFVASKAAWADRLLPEGWWQAKEQRARIVILRAREANAQEFPAAAIELREAAADGAPSDPRALLNLADTYLQVDDLGAANEALGRVLAVDPWSIPALNARARTAIGGGQTKLAESLLERSLIAAPDQDETKMLLDEIKSD